MVKRPGSNSHQAADTMLRHLHALGITRLLVVGGTPRLHLELTQLLAASGLELRCINGKARVYRRRDARPVLAWAHLVIICAGSPLPHKVSALYSARHPDGPPVIVATGGGIGVLTTAVLQQTPSRRQCA